jgi:hypothetical protein
MAMGPVDYTIDVVNPLEGFARGYGIGGQVLAAQQQRAAQQAAAEQNARIQGLFDKVYEGTAVSEDYHKLMALLPEEQSKAVREAYASLTQEQQQSELNSLAPVFNAFRVGAPGVAIDLIKDEAAAQRAAGNEQAAQTMDMYAQLAESGPDGAKAAEAYFGSMMSQLPGGADILDRIKTHWETNEIIAGIERAQQEAAEGDATKIFQWEDIIRKQFRSRVSELDDARLDYNKLQASAQDDSGAGDVALIFSFMRMLDPGSVVRESEFAQARDTTGLLGRLEVMYEGLKQGEKLTGPQRENFVNLAREYMEAAEENEQVIRQDYEKIVTDYGLDEERVFGQVVADEAAAQAQERAGEVGTFKNYVISNTITNASRPEPSQPQPEPSSDPEPPSQEFTSIDEYNQQMLNEQAAMNQEIDQLEQKENEKQKMAKSKNKNKNKSKKPKKPKKQVETPPAPAYNPEPEELNVPDSSAESMTVDGQEGQAVGTLN